MTNAAWSICFGFLGPELFSPLEPINERENRYPLSDPRDKFGLQFLPDVITSVDSGITRVANVYDTFEIS